MLIRQVTLTAANVHDSQEFENVVHGDEEMVMANRLIGVRPAANGAGNTAWPTASCASPVVAKAPPGHRANETVVEFDSL